MADNVHPAKRTISDRAANATARAVVGLFVLFSWIAAAPAVHAQSDELFTISDIAVDKQADTAAKARELALAEGYDEAFRRLLERLVPQDKMNLVPKLETKALTALVRDFEVTDEKTSAVRYLAKLRIRFERQSVRAVLRDARVPYAETQSKPMVVLPLLHRAGITLLWDRPNTWLKAWTTVPMRGGLVPMIVPKGGLGDLRIISAAQAARRDPARINDIARSYHAAGALIVTARPHASQVSVTVRRSDDRQNRAWQTVIRRREGESDGDLMRRAASETATFIQEQWKRENLLRFDQQNQISVVVPLEELTQWVSVRRRVEDLAFVSKAELVGISRTEAKLLLSYVGDEQQLKTAMAQKDMRLSREDDSWFLYYTPRGGIASGGTTTR